MSRSNNQSKQRPYPPPPNGRSAWINVLYQAKDHLTHPMVIFGAGAVCSLFIKSKLKEMYHRNFVEPYLLRGAFRDSALHIRSTYRIIENCLLSEVHVENSTLIVESGVIHKLYVNDNSVVILNGGLIKGEIIIMGKNSTVKLMRDSIVEADIFTISPQQLQQKSGLLRGNVHIIVVQKQDESGNKQITVTSSANSMQQMNGNNSINNMHQPSPMLQQMQPQMPMHQFPQRSHASSNSIHSIRPSTNDFDTSSQHSNRVYTFRPV